ARIDGAGSVGGDVDAVAVFIPGVSLFAELVDERKQRGLVRRDPLTAEFEHLTVDVIGPGASAHTITRLEDDDAASGLPQPAGCAQARWACSDDDDVTGFFRHWRSPRKGLGCWLQVRQPTVESQGRK